MALHDSIIQLVEQQILQMEKQMTAEKNIDHDPCLVSVLIPAYNVEKYIERCINSVVNQNYSPLECVIVDDGSSDGTSDRIRTFLQDYKGDVSFTFIHQEKNLGVAATRNHLVEAAKGDYVFFLDSDDEIISECISLMMSSVKAHPDIEVVQGLIHSIPDNAIYHLDRYKDIEYMDDNNWLRRDFFKNVDYFPCQVWNKLIASSFIKTYGLYFKPGIIHEDHDWMIHAARKLSKFSFVHYHTYIHHYRDNSIMMTNNNYSQYSNDSWAKILNDALSTIDEPFPIHQLNKLCTEFLYRYHLDRESYNEVKQTLLHAMCKYRLYLGAVLILLFTIFFKNKGNWRCKTFITKHLTSKADKESY